ncbi:MAG: S41 family peptidase [Flavobacteriaceae bacterium]|nr:S41 family peptidase [Flavobacteriaceae bacterium]
MKDYLKPFMYALLIAFGIVLGSLLSFNAKPAFLSKNSGKEKLSRLIDYIDKEYVDNVNTDSIVDLTVNSILAKLDPHSVYIPKSEMAATAENMKGDFVGIGVNFYFYKDSLAVINPVPGSPSQKVGIKAGDRILFAGNRKLFGADVTTDTLVNLLKGEVNSEVDLEVYRRGEKELLKFKISRDHIPIKSVDASYMLTPELGYIKINRFAESTYQEFTTALDSLIALNAKELVLDLRGNPGGYVGIAEKILDEFLPKDTPMLTTKNKSGKETKGIATAKGRFENKPLYVLIDENSASASEIVAGALQDNDIGTIVGRRSFGKGLVQREMALGDGSAVRLTIARYYTPTGRSIQRPYENGVNAYYDDFYNRYENGEFIDKDSIKVDDSLKFKTPKGKIVYGGGGIIPDVFVPTDTIQGSEALRYLELNGNFNFFIFESIDENRETFSALTFKDFDRENVFPDSLVNKFINSYTERGLRLQYQSFKDKLKVYLTANLAGQLFGNEYKAILLNKEDPVIRRVLELDKK